MKKGLYKSTKDVQFDGVLGGLAEHFDIDSSNLRILFLLITCAGFPGLLFYALCILFLPTDVELELKNSEAVSVVDSEVDSIIDLNKK